MCSCYCHISNNRKAVIVLLGITLTSIYVLISGYKYKYTYEELNMEKPLRHITGITILYVYMTTTIINQLNITISHYNT